MLTCMLRVDGWRANVTGCKLVVLSSVVSAATTATTTMTVVVAHTTRTTLRTTTTDGLQIVVDESQLVSLCSGARSKVFVVHKMLKESKFSSSSFVVVVVG